MSVEYRCVKKLSLERYDDNGFLSEGMLVVEPGTMWQINNQNNIIGGEVHLDACDGYDWLEISKETLAKYFEQCAVNEHTDRSNEMLSGLDMLNAFDKCLSCENLTPCEENNWTITCDKDGVTCDNYKPLSEPEEDGREKSM